MNFKVFYKAFFVLKVAIFFMISFEVQAALWQLTPRVSLEEKYDDNIRLTTGPHDAVTGTLLKGMFDFSRQTEISGVTGQALINLSKYTGDPVVTNKNDNVKLKLSTFYKTELSKWKFNGSIKRDTTLRTLDALEEELSADDIDEGLITLDIRRYRLELQPSWSYKINERESLSLGYQYTDVRYEDNRVGSGVFNFKQNGLSGSYLYRLSERNTVNLTGSVSRFTSPDNFDNEVDSYTFTAGYTRRISEGTNASLDVGVNKSTQTSSVLNTENTGFVISLKLDHKTELGQYQVELNRDLKPSGSGSVTEVSQLKFKAKKKLSERLNGLLAIRYVEKRSIESLATGTRRFYAIEPRLSWKLNRWWQVGGGYVYRNNRRTGAAATADSNVVFISLTHNKPVTFD